MSNALANLKGLEGLLSSGYSLSATSGYLIVNDVWYVDGAGALRKGHLAAPLTLTTQTQIGVPPTHQMCWSGTPPYFADGSIITLAAASVAGWQLNGVNYIWWLSNKPPEGFSTYAALVEHYVALISGPAEQKFGVTARTGAIYDVSEDESPFKVLDTFSARAQITDLNERLKDEQIAIIGLGGTGAFVLDFMVKTPVHSIDAYDFDVFEVHNGFRSPGEVSLELFGHPKTALYEHKYNPFRHRLRFHRKRVGAGDEALFVDTTFAFVCIDDGESRAEIFALLQARNIPFIDVGMGVEKETSGLDGLLRTTLVTDATASRAVDQVPFDKREEAGAYRVLVQIAELNALNAAMAVIRYKQMRGFYTDDTNNYNLLLSIGLSKIMGLA